MVSPWPVKPGGAEAEDASGSTQGILWALTPQAFDTNRHMGCSCALCYPYPHPHPYPGNPATIRGCNFLRSGLGCEEDLGKLHHPGHPLLSPFLSPQGGGQPLLRPRPGVGPAEEPHEEEQHQDTALQGTYRGCTVPAVTPGAGGEDGEVSVGRVGSQVITWELSLGWLCPLFPVADRVSLSQVQPLLCALHQTQQQEGESRGSPACAPCPGHG